MKTIKYFGIYILCCICCSGCSDILTNPHRLVGTISNERGEAISEVSVTLQNETISRTTTTGDDGKYKFENLELGIYNITVSKPGFEELKEEVSVWRRDRVFNCQLSSGISNRKAASVSITDFIAISDGIYVWFTPSANTKKYYWSFYSGGGDLAGVSDAEIIADLQDYGVDMDINDTQSGYSWDLSPSTTYIFCIIAYDAQNKPGTLVKKTISTKSPINQPVATISTSSIGSGKVTYSITKSSNCAKYVNIFWYNVNSDNYDKPDIWWASDLYQYRNNSGYVESENYENYTWTPIASGDCAIVTLGCTSAGEYSGVISKKFFNTTTGILRSAQIETKQHELKKSMAKEQKTKQSKSTFRILGY